MVPSKGTFLEKMFPESQKTKKLKNSDYQKFRILALLTSEFIVPKKEFCFDFALY